MTIDEAARITDDNEEESILVLAFGIIRGQIQRIFTACIQVSVCFINRFSPVSSINAGDRIYALAQVTIVLCQRCVGGIHIELHTLYEQRSCIQFLHRIHSKSLRRYKRMEIEGDDRVFHRHTILEGNGVIPFHGIFNRINQFVVITDGILETTALAYIYRDGIIECVTKRVRDQFCPDMSYLIRIEINDHIRPTELLEEVTVDINRVLAFCCQRIALALGSRIIAIEIEIRVEIVVRRCAPVINMETEVTGIRNDNRIQIHMVPCVSTRRVHITVLPVECHRVGTLVSGDLRYIQFNLQVVIRLDADIAGDRVAGNITVQHTVHKGLLECRYIKIAVGDALDGLINQFAERLGAFVVSTALVDCTLTNRHLAIHLILEREGAFDRCWAVQLIIKCAGSGVDIVILDHRDTYHIPVFLVVTRNYVLYVRNQQFGFCLSRINGLRRILTIEFGSEIERVGSAHLDIEFYITEAIYSLSRYVVRFALTFLNRALAIVAQAEFIYKVSLGEQAFVNSHTHFGVAVAGVLTRYSQYFVVQILVFLEVCGIQFVPHLRVSGLAISLVHADRKSVIAGITAERFHQFRSELEVTASYRTGYANND